VAQAGCVGQDNTVAWWPKPVVLVKPPLSAGGSSKLCCLREYYLLVAQVDSDSFNNTAGLFVEPAVMS